MLGASTDSVIEKVCFDCFFQLEDDVLSTPGFMSRVTGFIQEREHISPGWVFLEFSALGFIG